MHIVFLQSDGGAAVANAGESTLKIILQKFKPGLWGGDFGANEKNVCMTISYNVDAEEKGSHLNGTDLLRYILQAFYKNLHL